MIVSLEAKETNAYNRYAICPAGQLRVKKIRNMSSGKKSFIVRSSNHSDVRT